MGLSAGGVYMLLESGSDGSADDGEDPAANEAGESAGEEEDGGEDGAAPATKEDLGSAGGTTGGGEGGDGGDAGQDAGTPPAKQDLGAPEVVQTPQGGTAMKISSVKTPSDIDAGRLRTAVGNQKRKMDECFAKHEFIAPPHEFVDLRLKIEDGLVASVEGTGDRERNPSLDKCLGEALKDTDIGSKPIGGRGSVDVSLSAVIKRNQRL